MLRSALGGPAGQATHCWRCQGSNALIGEARVLFRLRSSDCGVQHACSYTQTDSLDRRLVFLALPFLFVSLETPTT